MAYLTIGVCEETTFHALKLFGVSVTLEVRLNPYNDLLRTLPSIVWSRLFGVVCEETMFQVLKLFGVGVTLEVRLHRMEAS